MVNQRILLDSNIVIYSSNADYDFLRQRLAPYDLVVSDISRLEVLGFSRITELEKRYFNEFFEAVECFIITPQIINHAIMLRQIKKMSLGDAIIASTALLHNLPIMTRNDSDFNWVQGLQVVNPFLIYFSPCSANVFHALWRR